MLLKKEHTKNPWKIPALFLAAVLVLTILLLLPKKNPIPVDVKSGSPPKVKIGYFHGGRTMLLYRAFIDNEFEKEGVSVDLFTRGLYQTEFTPLPKSYEEIKEEELLGKVTGGDLIDGVIKGEFAAATPGESSFIDAATRGLPIVAVAELGHDVKGQGGHAIIFRKDVVIKKPEDIKGRILASRRAGDGDAVFLREFLKSVGLDPEKDVIIKEQVMDDELNRALIDGKIDGGFFHLMAVEKLVEKGYAYVYQKFDWVNPELAQALLVFHKDFIKDHPEEVEKIIRAYMKRVKYEHGLPREVRLKDPGKGFLKGLQMEKDFQGMNLPQYDFPPLVSPDLLGQMQDLLFKYKYIDKKVNLEDFIDNRFVEKVYEDLK